jgi:hypothetical protein
MKKMILALAILVTFAVSCKKVETTSDEVTVDSTEVVVDTTNVEIIDESTESVSPEDAEVVEVK